MAEATAGLTAPPPRVVDDGVIGSGRGAARIGAGKRYSPRALLATSFRYEPGVFCVTFLNERIK
jgi:hypothetical protein